MYKRQDYWYALGVSSTPDGKYSDTTRTLTKIDPLTGLPVNVVEKYRTVTSEQVMTRCV